MSKEEANSQYKCTVREYHALHKWDTGGTPSQSMKIQEMDVDGQGIRETGGSVSESDRCFDKKISNSHLVQVYMLSTRQKSPRQQKKQKL